jgi:ureidoacrylate peracid hydrolase
VLSKESVRDAARTVSLQTRPETIDVDLERTALIVVDMQNAFASKGGMFDLAGFDISGAGPVIEANRRLLDASRKAGITVVFLQMTFKPDLSDAGDESSPAYHKELALRMMRARPELSGTLLIENTWDWQIVDALQPAPHEHVVRKSRYNGFIRSDLESHLVAHNIRYLLFTGVATNVCVASTAQHAFYKDFWPILIEDAVNNSGPEYNQQSTLWNFEHAMGWVTRSDQVISALQTSSAQVPAAHLAVAAAD